jgi:hypothetical protein
MGMRRRGFMFLCRKLKNFSAKEPSTIPHSISSLFRPERLKGVALRPCWRAGKPLSLDPEHLLFFFFQVNIKTQKVSIMQLRARAGAGASKQIFFSPWSSHWSSLFCISYYTYVSFFSLFFLCLVYIAWAGCQIADGGSIWIVPKFQGSVTVQPIHQGSCVSNFFKWCLIFRCRGV